MTNDLPVTLHHVPCTPYCIFSILLINVYIIYYVGYSIINFYTSL